MQRRHIPRGFEILNIGLEIQESFDFEISDFPIPWVKGTLPLHPPSALLNFSLDGRTASDDITGNH
jgi:hypothetical protein